MAKAKKAKKVSKVAGGAGKIAATHKVGHHSHTKNNPQRHKKG